MLGYAGAFILGLVVGGIFLATRPSKPPQVTHEERSKARYGAFMRDQK